MIFFRGIVVYLAEFTKIYGIRLLIAMNSFRIYMYPI